MYNIQGAIVLYAYISDDDDNTEISSPAPLAIRAGCRSKDQSSSNSRFIGPAVHAFITYTYISYNMYCKRLDTMVSVSGGDLHFGIDRLLAGSSLPLGGSSFVLGQRIIIITVVYM